MKIWNNIKIKTTFINNRIFFFFNNFFIFVWAHYLIKIYGIYGNNFEKLSLKNTNLVID